MKIFGIHDGNTLTQFADVSSRAVKAALMADGHMGYVMPIGGVAGYDNKVSVVGVGFDIACGNCAIKTDLKFEDLFGMDHRYLSTNPHKFTSNRTGIELANHIFNKFEFGIGTKNTSPDAPNDHKLFHDPAWWIIPNTGAYRDDLIQKAREQIGTIGSGNHYIDIFSDKEDGTIWVGVHFGSRGLGHTIASNFLALSQGMSWGEKGKEVEVLLDLDSDLGRDYWALMELAGKYAYAGRAWVARKVVSMLGGQEVDMVHNNHNFAWKETHEVVIDGTPALQELVVVRKGATPAFPGQRGFVGGSMGDNAVILEGTRPETFPNSYVLPEQMDALYSTVHGAGRVMSRTEAKGKTTRSGVVKKVGKVTQSMMDGWLAQKGVIRKGGGLDESPHAYRRLGEVLEAQGDTINVLHTLRPVITCMAPEKPF